MADVTAIPMGIPWDPWDPSLPHSHAHLYSRRVCAVSAGGDVGRNQSCEFLQLDGQHACTAAGSAAGHLAIQRHRLGHLLAPGSHPRSHGPPAATGDASLETTPTPHFWYPSRCLDDVFWSRSQSQSQIWTKLEFANWSSEHILSSWNTCVQDWSSL